MATYRKRPVEVEAFKWTGGPDQTEDPEWAVEAIKDGTVSFENRGTPDVALLVRTLEGTMRAEQGDYIIKGIKGELYPCKPDVFEAAYDEVPGQTDWKRAVVRANDILNDLVNDEGCGTIDLPNIAYGCIMTASQALGTVEDECIGDAEALR